MGTGRYLSPKHQASDPIFGLKAPMVPRALEALYGAQESYRARPVSGFADATGEQGVGITS
jgi:hypothetical protein